MEIERTKLINEIAESNKLLRKKKKPSDIKIIEEEIDLKQKKLDMLKGGGNKETMNYKDFH